jgi:hypothetical protein
MKTEDQVQKARARQKRYYEKNREKALAASKKWNQENKDKMCEASMRAYNKLRLDEDFKKLQAQKTREWAKNNQDKVLEQSARKRASKLKRIPGWVIQEDLDQIRLLYKKAREISFETGVKHHVDHIIPLRGKSVSGLHVLSNLRIVTAKENMEKSNKLTELTNGRSI